ncbi:hypothetical protein HZ326_18823 [Fusarium oxysporum f. sp. albedinis]|nr:hypothetical protein HZ326_18823 [Fusarium oxysporum f. sp. albedinis]
MSQPRTIRWKSLLQVTQARGYCDAPTYAKAYGSYAELVKDPDVEVVYIAMPHCRHFHNTMLCLEAARMCFAKRLLLSTRYFPLSLYVQEIIESGRIGPLERVLAEHSLSYAGGFVDDNHIMMDPMLAGGIPVGGELSRQPPLLKSAVAKYDYTEVDAMSTILLEFSRSKADGGTDHAVTSTSLRLSNDSIAKENDAMVPNIRIQGQYGEVQIFPPAYRPTRTRLSIAAVVVAGHRE